MDNRLDLHAVVIAGGSGTRFWPLSRRTKPKQLLNLSGEGSLLASTFERVAPIAPRDHWWMVVGASHADGCIEAAPRVAREHALIEPVARNTAPAIALAAVHLQRIAPDGIMVVLPADHHVSDADALCDALTRAAQVAAKGPIVTLGIKPTHPETGYGYIHRGKPYGEASSPSPSTFRGAFVVQRFCEKPSVERAQKFLADGGYDWNAGIFVMRPDSYLREVERQLPELYRAMLAVQDAIGTSEYNRVVEDAYHRIPSISIDYGVMENAREVCVVPVDCGWSNVGSWSALGSVVSTMDGDNIVSGRALAVDASNCILYATPKHAVAVVGMQDVVVVHTEDATLVVPTSRAQDVREVIAQLSERGWTDLL